MHVEILIFIYGAVCVSMIVFNIVYNLVLKGSEPRMVKRCDRFYQNLNTQLEKIEKGFHVEDDHQVFLRRTLQKMNNLIAFDRVLGQIWKTRPETGKRYFRQIQGPMLYLANRYKEKDPVQAGYFCYFLSRYAVSRHIPVDTLQDLLLDYVRKENLYCRINAFKALLQFADTEHILLALKIQDDGAVFLHEKILTEELLAFPGSHSELISRLWEQLDQFTQHTQLAILNYIRFQTGAYKKEMFSIMQNPERDKELRLSAIRYFGRYFYREAVPMLLAFLKNEDGTQWEYATVAAGALAKYPEACVVTALKNALHSRNWYVRYSAAQSLEAQHVEYSSLTDIVAGNDRYAREMMLYRLESGKLQKMEE